MDQQQAHASFVTRIHAGMEVVAADGLRIGIVDGIAGDEIKLAGSAADGEDSFVPLSLVDAVEDTRVIVRSRGDNAFGVAAG